MCTLVYTPLPSSQEEVIVGSAWWLLYDWSMHANQPRDSKGRFVKATMNVTAAPSYIAFAVGMDRVEADAPAAVEALQAAVAPQTVTATARTPRRPLLPSGGLASFAVWLVVMLASCYKVWG